MAGSASFNNFGGISDLGLEIVFSLPNLQQNNWKLTENELETFLDNIQNT